MGTSTGTNMRVPLRVSAFLALERHVRVLQRSIDFYVQGLGFHLVAPDGDRRIRADAVLALGDERIALLVMPPGREGAAVVDGPDVRFQHVAIVTCDMTAALQRLERLERMALVPITRGGPQRLPEASGGATAFKFRDPDGHPLELIAFAAGHVPERWQTRACEQPTLGIDHAAISVSQVERSIDFYRGMGFQVRARQRNVGAEQARLDGLDTAEVEVVALEIPGSTGAHLELLAYRQPTPRSMKAVVPAADAGRFVDRLAWAGTPAPRALADPDGHLHRLAALSA